MTIQEFGDAFKAQITNRKTEMGLNAPADAATFFDATHHYAAGESDLIDNFFNADGGGNPLFTDAELRNAPDAGDDKGDTTGNVED